MKNVLLKLLVFILGFCVVLGLRYLQVKNIPTFVPQTSTFQLTPPSQSVSGILTITRGKAEKLSRTDIEYKEASSGARVLLGESVATKKNSAAVATISGIVYVSFGPNAELVFANLFPDDMVLQQKNGKIDYVATKPLSVRALHTLVSINPGETIINVIDTDIFIAVKTGSVKLAIVDTDNNTHMYELRTGQRANIDDAAREVLLVGQG